MRILFFVIYTLDTTYPQKATNIFKKVKKMLYNSLKNGNRRAFNLLNYLDDSHYSLSPKTCHFTSFAR